VKKRHREMAGREEPAAWEMQIPQSIQETNVESLLILCAYGPSQTGRRNCSFS